jgi:hypothetical protein
MDTCVGALGIARAAEPPGDRRDAPRFNIYLQAMVRAAGDRGGAWHRAQTINVSRTGASLFSTRPWTMHQVLDLGIAQGRRAGRGSSPAGRFLSAWVVRVDALPRRAWGGGEAYAIGVQFDVEVDVGTLAEGAGVAATG